LTVSINSSGNSKPERLPAVFKEKVWGSTRLSPWYPDSTQKIGEVWFEADLPILIKFIFTTEKLSVQVHPKDEFAQQHESSRGKTEMWHILRADRGAQIALGFRESIDGARLRQASLSGEIESLLNWVDVRPGETYFTPAGTVHAIGAGIALCEIQQNSDVTYRLYDYGRPRELHLDKAVEVTDTSAFDPQPTKLPIECSYFHTDRLSVDTRLRYAGHMDHFHVLIVLDGEGTIAGDPYRLGEAWFIPKGCDPFVIQPQSTTTLLRTWVP
jgi:mannose-6-phosphate isomerase